MSAIFAYEPKAECAKVKRNGDIKYFEKTEPYSYFGLVDPDKESVQWVIRKDYTVEQLVNYQYERLESLRDSYNHFIKDAENPKPTGLTESICELRRLYDGTEISPEEQDRNTSLRCAKIKKDTAIISLVCVTEENFLTLTKEEMLNKLNDFINNLY